jgi:hypothetical protein
MPRRSTKTTSIFAWITGMCLLHKGWQVAYTAATTGKSARDRFVKEILPEAERAQKDGAPIQIRKGAGQERIIFDNGSLLQVLAPLGNEFRGQAFDAVVVDEAGEADTLAGGELLAAILPTLATSKYGMLIVTGTAGEYRGGNLLWDSLEAGRAGKAAMVDYSYGDAVDTEQLGDWSYVAPLLEKYHPSVGTLTTLERLELSWSMMDPHMFAREYLGVWGDKGGVGGIFDRAQWDALYLPGELPTPPRRFALAVAATEQSGSIVAAWREDGEARLLVLDGRPGRAWLPTAARDIARRYRIPVVVDPNVLSSSVMPDVVQRLEQLSPPPRVERQGYEDVAAAHERMVEEIRGARIRHYGQESLTSAFLSVRRVQMGGKWKFGRQSEEFDITAAQAAALALRYYDANVRTPMSVLAPIAV